MQKSKIEWTNYTLNPVKGLCPMDCKDNQGKSYCYARRMYKRFGWNPEIKYIDNWWQPLRRIYSGKIFMGSTFELFGDFVPEGTLDRIFKWVRVFNDLTFIFLTKKPENLIKYSPFPPNCWVGVSATSETMFLRACSKLERIQAKVKFISIEPLLEWGDSEHGGSLNNAVKHDLRLWLEDCGINWLIIGQCTPLSAKTVPKIEWIQEIEAAANYADIPVFEKNNLKDLIKYPLRQEFPKL